MLECMVYTINVNIIGVDTLMSSNKSNQTPAQSRRLTRAKGQPDSNSVVVREKLKHRKFKKILSFLYYFTALDSIIRSFKNIGNALSKMLLIGFLIKQTVKTVRAKPSALQPNPTLDERYKFLTTRNKFNLRIDEQHYLNFGVSLIVTLIFSTIYYFSEVTFILSKITCIAIILFFSFMTIASLICAIKIEKEILSYETSI